MIVKIVNKSDNALPQYVSGGSVCLYVRCAVDGVLNPGEFKLVKTGLSVEIPYGYEIQVRPRSGIALKYGVTVLNSPGTIDSGYNGEIKVIVYNTTSESIFIKKQQKIAQCGLYPVYVGSVVILQQLDSIQEKDRGENGFGSTGI
jgi:dUTP pyrophosphatase